MAAVVIGAHPTWTAAQVRSAIVNTANRVGLKGYSDGSPVSHPLIIGNGAASLPASLGAKLALNPVSTSFGAIPVGNGATWSRTIDVSVLSGSGAIDCSVSGAGYGCSVSGNVITVTYTPRAAGSNDNPGRLIVTQGGSPVATSVLFAWGK